MSCCLCAHPVAAVLVFREGKWRRRNFSDLGAGNLNLSTSWRNIGLRWRQGARCQSIGAGMSRRSGVFFCATFQQEAATRLQDSDAFPLLRSYENDLCVLEMMGDATAGDALAALASDGGRTAEEELASGKSLMTIDVTVSGSVGERSTVSTRILAPTKQVAERARAERGKRKGRKVGDGVFRALECVLMRQVLRFELQVRRPGYVREVGKEEGPLETVARIVSLDAKVLEALAGSVSSHAVACVINYTSEKAERGKWIPRLWSKEKWSPGPDSAVRLRRLSTTEISAQMKSGDLRFPERRGEWKIVRESHAWWPLHLNVNSAVAQEGDSWASEYVPAHMLQIDLDMVEVDVEGWESEKVGGSRVCTILLTHAQMVELANVLDCYYDDAFTVPDKQLVTRTDLQAPSGSRSGLMLAVTRAVLATVIGGVVLVGCLVAVRLNGVSLSRVDGSSMSSTVAPFISRHKSGSTKRKPLLPINKDLPAKEMEVLCRVVVAMIKDEVGWSEEIESRAGDGAWMGLDLTNWVKPKHGGLATAQDSLQQDVQSNLPAEEETGNSGDAASSFIAGNSTVSFDWENPVTLEKVLTYQVILSRDGKVIGFSPLNTVAIQKWAQFPLANALHKGMKIKPTFFERVPEHKGPPEDAVVIELLYLDDNAASSVTARPVKT